MTVGNAIIVSTGEQVLASPFYTGKLVWTDWNGNEQLILKLPRYSEAKKFLDPMKAERFIRSMIASGSIKQSCLLSGIPKSKFFQWKIDLAADPPEDPKSEAGRRYLYLEAFFEAVNLAMAIREQSINNALYDAATRMRYSKVLKSEVYYKNGAEVGRSESIVTHEHLPDARAAMHLQKMNGELEACGLEDEEGNPLNGDTTASILKIIERGVNNLEALPGASEDAEYRDVED